VSASAINWLIPNASAVACTRSPAHVHFDGTPPSRLPSPHISQVCWQLRLVASEQKLDIAQIRRHAARVVSRSSPQVHPSRRGRRRQETLTDIKTAARAQLAEGGPAGISLRAIARQLGMTPSAVHYYFAGREALLDALIVDGWDSLAIALFPERAATSLVNPAGHLAGTPSNPRCHRTGRGLKMNPDSPRRASHRRGGRPGPA
jgi:hypothetical protein